MTEKADIVARLRDAAKYGWNSPAELLDEAAEEIQRLRAKLANAAALTEKALDLTNKLIADIEKEERKLGYPLW